MFFNSKTWVLVVGAALAASACGPNRDPSSPHNGPGTIDGPQDFAVPEWDLISSNECGVQNFMLQPGLPPEVMVVLDRSGSMTMEFDNGTRWSKVAEAVKSAVSSLQGDIGWGLAVYPVDNDCGTSANVDVPIATNNGAAIAAKIDSYDPGGNTPTAEAVKKATANLAARTTANPKYLLLTSDGEPNCSSVSVSCTCLVGSPNAQGVCCLGPVCNFGNCIPLPMSDGVGAAEQAVKDAANQGVHTFVVGVATSGGTTSALNKLAVAGLESRPSDPKFYPVGSASDLVTAVNTIAGQIISCSFGLSTPPPTDLGLVEVNLNGALLPRDTTHANGWDFGPGNNSILFYGPACANLQSSTSADVKAVYKCPPPL